MTEVERAIRTGREARGIEFKSAMSWDDEQTKHKVARAVAALANHRDGGLLIFGLRPLQNGDHEPTGVLPEVASTFVEDDVRAFVNGRISPQVPFSVRPEEVDALVFVVIQVPQFDTEPIICTRSVGATGREAIRKGRLYCRSRRIPESVEVATPEDLREILDLGTEVSLRRYMKLRSLERDATNSDDESFATEAEDFVI